MATYETVMIARPDISAQQVEQLNEHFTNLIKENGGEVKKTEYWGLRSLSYRIKKSRKGHYVLHNLDAPAPAVQEMERQMRLHDDVLRYMTVKVDELEEGPSVQMQSRGGGRDGRRGGGRPGDRDRGPRRDGDDRGPRREGGNREGGGRDGGERREKEAS